MMVVDTSGSMQGAKINALKNALNHIVKTYKGRLRLGLISFAGEGAKLEMQLGPAKLTVPQDVDDHANKLLAKVQGLKAAGGTPLLKAIRFTRSNFTIILPDFPAHNDDDPDSRKRTFVLLMTDGYSSSDFGDTLIEMQRMHYLWVGPKQYEIRAFVLGFGKGFELDVRQLSSLANIGSMGDWIHVEDSAGLGNAMGKIPEQVSGELCNLRDDNCNGKIDENLSAPCTTDCGKGTKTCQNGEWSACSAPAKSDEICDGKDNDCDGQVDEGDLCPGGWCLPNGPASARCEDDCARIPCPSGLRCDPNTNKCVKPEVIDKTTGTCHKDDDCKQDGFVCQAEKCIASHLVAKACACSSSNQPNSLLPLILLTLALLQLQRHRRRQP